MLLPGALLLGPPPQPARQAVAIEAAIPSRIFIALPVELIVIWNAVLDRHRPYERPRKSRSCDSHRLQQRLGNPALGHGFLQAAQFHDARLFLRQIRRKALVTSGGCKPLPFQSEPAGAPSESAPRLAGSSANPSQGAGRFTRRKTRNPTTPRTTSRAPRRLKAPIMRPARATETAG